MNGSAAKIGVLALQGAFEEHSRMLSSLGVRNFEVRQKSDLFRSLDGLILPGGESTSMGKLLDSFGMLLPLRSLAAEGLPMFGTCAGLLLLAKRIINDSHVYIGAMDISARRNAYGRQLASFSTEAAFEGIGKVPMVFIRAPYIEQATDDVKILARVNGRAVAARQKNFLVTAFHPELTGCTKEHEMFLHMIGENQPDSRGRRA